MASQYARAVRYERGDNCVASADTRAPMQRRRSESLLLTGELDDAETIARGLMTERPDLLNPPTNLGRIAARRGDTTTVAEIDRLLAERATERWNRGRATYRRARLAAVQGDGARAAQLLEQAWQEGYSIYVNLWADPEFVAVLSHPAMRTLLTPRG